MSNLEAGHELDALVAEKVMGWKRVEGRNTFHWDDAEGNPRALEGFSTDIAAAWEVIAQLGNSGFNVRIEVQNRTEAFLWTKQGNEYTTQIVKKVAFTAPLAICLAALKAMGQD